MPERPTGRAPRLRAGRGLRSLRPALKKLWKQKFKLVMALPTSRHGSKVSRNLGGFFRNNPPLGFLVFYSSVTATHGTVGHPKAL